MLPFNLGGLNGLSSRGRITTLSLSNEVDRDFSPDFAGICWFKGSSGDNSW